MRWFVFLLVAAALVVGVAVCEEPTSKADLSSESELHPDTATGS